METSDREPKYLGTHRGVARVQIGWTTLYFRGDSYTHALGSLYGTQESPTREEITAARKVIPVTPRPPVMANAPSTERAASRKAENATKAKPGAEGKKDAKPAEKPAAKPKPSAAKPKPSAAKPPRAKKDAAHAREPAKEQKASKPRSSAPKPKTAAEPKPRARKGKRATAEAPIATMAELLAKVEATPGKLGATREPVIDSMAALEAQIA
jgi:hypothetical protein